MQSILSFWVISGGHCDQVYSAIPFLNELRVITDWTVTETCMNLFMWMKLEDAHHSLYRTRLDMEGRLD